MRATPTLEIDEVLLNKAKKILGTPTIRETVEKSLQAVVRQQALNRLADSLGKIDLIDMTGEGLRKQRRARLPRELR
jgi:Arc/MetJ family transcription regulator